MTQHANPAPVITIDGPTASGKGTVTRLVAQALKFHVLDSGALYRLTAWAALDQNVDPNDIAKVADLARRMQVRFSGQHVYLAGVDVTESIRQEHVGNLASRLAPQPTLREALLERQREFQKAPGLVADGRDMGTIVFPDAELKVFLTAKAQARAKRRCEQLRERGVTPDEQAVLLDLQKRDERDTKRSIAPLLPAEDAHQIDSSELSIDETVQQILSLWQTAVAQTKNML